MGKSSPLSRGAIRAIGVFEQRQFGQQHAVAGIGGAAELRLESGRAELPCGEAFRPVAGRGGEVVGIGGAEPFQMVRQHPAGPPPGT